jgi:hypothetical protein
MTRQLHLSAVKILRTGADGGHLYIKGCGEVPGEGECDIFAYFHSKKPSAILSASFLVNPLLSRRILWRLRAVWADLSERSCHGDSNDVRSLRLGVFHLHYPTAQTLGVGLRLRFGLEWRGENPMDCGGKMPGSLVVAVRMLYCFCHNFQPALLRRCLGH